jgi:UDP-glucose 4-epimerase
MVDSHLFKEEQKESPPRVTFFKGSILDSKFLEKALEGVDTVFHTAALVNFWERLPHQFDKIYSINVTGTEVRFFSIIELPIDAYSSLLN